MKVILVVGTRPNFMKVAPILEAMKAYPEIEPRLVHTGQHYDHQMSQVFFEDLELPEPDVYLGVGSGSHAKQTADIMVAFEPVVQEQAPDWIVVVGDVNSTAACALVGAKLNVPVAHVEAGIRSFDRTMPEEINRIVTDAVSTYLFPPSQYGYDNLMREGKSPDQVFLVGNTMIDTLRRWEPVARTRQKHLQLGLKADYALMTLHRPHNVDNRGNLMGILEAIESIQRKIPVVFPVHPRTVQRLKDFGLAERLLNMPNLFQEKPMGYLDFLSLMMHARLVLSDSGGIQEETAVLGVPCLTMRENTERPETLTLGTSRLVGNCPNRIRQAVDEVLAAPPPLPCYPLIWDGKAGVRIVERLVEGTP
jgi:UDP-N-acetylglucosamine 2-epimerase (non-hydrolysing)